MKRISGAATTKGISRIDINRPSSFFGVNQGITNDVTYSAFHNKMQYIVGGLGGYLYRFPEKVENSIEDFKIEYINGFHECKHTLEINDHIILSNWYGLAEIVNNKTIPLLKGKRVFCSAYTKKYPNTIAVGKNHAIVIGYFLKKAWAIILFKLLIPLKSRKTSVRFAPWNLTNRGIYGLLRITKVFLRLILIRMI